MNSNLDVKNLRDDKFVTVSSDLSLHNRKYAFMSYAIFSQKSVLL